MSQMVNPGPAHIPKVFVDCDLSDTARVWGYILPQQGSIVDERQKTLVGPGSPQPQIEFAACLTFSLYVWMKLSGN